MKKWSERAEEVSSLLNPAFLSHLIYSGVSSAESVTLDGADFIMPFLALPLVLHPRTSVLIPDNAKLSFQKWTLERFSLNDILADFPDYASALTPYIKESLIFGVQNGMLSINDSGKLGTIYSKKFQLPKYNKKYHKKMCTCGIWFSNEETISFAMNYLKVRP